MPMMRASAAHQQAPATGRTRRAGHPKSLVDVKVKGSAEVLNVVLPERHAKRVGERITNGVGMTDAFVFNDLGDRVVVAHGKRAYDEFHPS